MVPTRDHAGVRVHEPAPRAVGGNRLLPTHPRRRRTGASTGLVDMHHRLGLAHRSPLFLRRADDGTRWQSRDLYHRRARAWWNGRHAGFRCRCSRERGGSSPSARTINTRVRRRLTRSWVDAEFNRYGGARSSVSSTVPSARQNRGSPSTISTENRLWWISRWCRRHSSTRFDSAVGPPLVQWTTWCGSHHDDSLPQPGNTHPPSLTISAFRIHGGVIRGGPSHIERPGRRVGDHRVTRASQAHIS